MKNYKIWLAVVTLLLIINSITLAFIWFHKREDINPRHIPARISGEPKDFLISTLSLSPKQVALFDTMRNEHHNLTIKLNEQNHQLRDSLFNYIKKPQLDSAVINALSKKISDNQSTIEKATLYHFHKLRGILDTGQKTKFDNVIQDVLQMMGRPQHAAHPGEMAIQPKGPHFRHTPRHPHFKDGPPPPGEGPPPHDRRPRQGRPEGPPPPDGGPDGVPPYGPRPPE